MKPIIGVMPLFDTEKNSIWMLPGYLKGIEDAGGIPLVIPYTTDTAILEETDKIIDAYLFTGGNDVDPALYDEANVSSKDVNEIRDTMEKFIYDLAKKENKPVLGICRGIQIINALEGGTLYQDLASEHKSAEHHIQKAPYDKPAHEVILLYESPLHKLLGTERLSVNSYHHQAIKKLAPGLRIMAMALDDIVEGIYDKKRLFMWAIQWHPEFATEWESSKKIFGKFIEMAEVWHNEYSCS